MFRETRYAMEKQREAARFGLYAMYLDARNWTALLLASAKGWAQHFAARFVIDVEAAAERGAARAIDSRGLSAPAPMVTPVEPVSGRKGPENGLEKGPDGLTDRQREAVMWLRANPGATAAEMREALGCGMRMFYLAEKYLEGE